MFIKIKQTVANSRNLFDISINGDVSLKGKCPISSPYFSSQLIDGEGNVIFKTKFQPMTELINSVPFKWVVSPQLSQVCTILDGEDNTEGIICDTTVGLMNGFYSVNYKNTEIKAYEISRGRYTYLLLFVEGKQIGQMVKKTTAEGNLDVYTVYLLDQYSNFAEITSLFILYYDNWVYSHRGEFVLEKQEVEWKWTYSKTNSIYDPQWLTNHFIVENIETDDIEDAFKARVRFILKVNAAIWGIGLSLIAIVGLFVLLK